MSKASSVDAFCSDHNISRSMYYKLRAAGKAPREMKVGTRTLISDEAAADWRRAREAETAAKGGTERDAAFCLDGTNGRAA